MKTQLKLFLSFLLFASLTIISCKKTSDTNDFSNEATSQSEDETQVSNEVDALANDYNNVVDNFSILSGRVDNSTALPCDATITVDSSSSPRKVVITYNGSNCNGTRTRSGKVTLSLPTGVRWKDAGAILTVEIVNLKITRVADGKSITLNGTKTVKNVTGGLLKNLATAGTITHEINSSGMSITFDNGSQRSWQIAKRRVFTYNNGAVITTSGLGTVAGVTGVAEWGTNRNGNEFATAISSPLIVRQDCNFRLTVGEVKHYRLAFTITVTFGLDAQGAPTTCPSGAYYFKAVYTGANGNVRTVIRPY